MYLDQFLGDLEKKLQNLQKRNDCDLKTLAALRVSRLSISPAQTVSLDKEIRKLTPQIIDQETRISELQTKIRQTRPDA
jgi:hypothetical protein